MGMHRSELQRRRRQDAAETKARNVIGKVKERVRRDTRMVEKIKTEEWPHSPTVMSWLSRKLGKRAVRITPDDVKTLRT